ncbi:hypothetical protein D932_00091 [Enterococcus casseliflavus 14-MB-W-14]|nr:hypothetical protein D932_00091 [Enterococcus casseliflavus 14-MB-W-14]
MGINIPHEAAPLLPFLVKGSLSFFIFPRSSFATADCPLNLFLQATLPIIIEFFDKKPVDGSQ